MPDSNIPESVMTGSHPQQTDLWWLGVGSKSKGQLLGQFQHGALSSLLTMARKLSTAEYMSKQSKFFVVLTSISAECRVKF